MTLLPQDVLAIVLIGLGVVGGVLYAMILLRQGAGRRNSRIEILISAGGLMFLGILARSLDRPEQWLQASVVGVLLTFLIANQWRWHLRTRGGL